ACPSTIRFSRRACAAPCASLRSNCRNAASPTSRHAPTSDSRLSTERPGHAHGILHPRTFPSGATCPMADENDFFRPVSDFCQRKVVTCVPDASLVDVVGIMREKNISSVVVCEGDAPSGIITDRDLRNKVVAPGKDPKSLRVADIMNAPLSVIGEDDVLYEA